ncbi:nucleoside hydrolase [Larkinella harenae]
MSTIVPAPPVEKTVPVILDTDMDSDVDDVGALAMLHTYEQTRKARILGVIVTSDEEYSAACTDAINTWFGRKDIPIGVSQRDSLKAFSRYTKQIAQHFPHRVTNRTAEESTVVYRRLLASQPDHSVVIITIGHLTSLSRLLNSPADAISPLTGQQLVARKVSRWSCMGGQFPQGKEANFYRPDPASTVFCLTHWTLPVTFAGWEVGNMLVTGGESFKARCSPSSPVYQAYQQYNAFKGRASWDQVAVLEAVEGTKPYFGVESNGHCTVTPDGHNEWKPARTSAKKHTYLTIKAPVDQIQQRIESLMLGK